MTFYITDKELEPPTLTQAKEAASLASIAWKAAKGRRDGSLGRHAKAYIKATADLIAIELAPGRPF